MPERDGDDGLRERFAVVESQINTMCNHVTRSIEAAHEKIEMLEKTAHAFEMASQALQYSGKADQERIKMIEGTLKEIRDERKWLWRTALAALAAPFLLFGWELLKMVLAR